MSSDMSSLFQTSILDSLKEKPVTVHGEAFVLFDVFGMAWKNMFGDAWTREDDMKLRSINTRMDNIHKTDGLLTLVVKWFGRISSVINRFVFGETEAETLLRDFIGRADVFLGREESTYTRDDCIECAALHKSGLKLTAIYASEGGGNPATASLIRQVTEKLPGLLVLSKLLIMRPRHVLVILYGAPGAGKTSVVSFIKSFVAKHFGSNVENAWAELRPDSDGRVDNYHGQPFVHLNDLWQNREGLAAHSTFLSAMCDSTPFPMHSARMEMKAQPCQSIFTVVSTNLTPYTTPMGLISDDAVWRRCSVLAKVSLRDESKPFPLDVRPTTEIIKHYSVIRAHTPKGKQPIMPTDLADLCTNVCRMIRKNRREYELEDKFMADEISSLEAVISRREHSGSSIPPPIDFSHFATESSDVETRRGRSRSSSPAPSIVSDTEEVDDGVEYFSGDDEGYGLVNVFGQSASNQTWYTYGGVPVTCDLSFSEKVRAVVGRLYTLAGKTFLVQGMLPYTVGPLPQDLYDDPNVLLCIRSAQSLCDSRPFDWTSLIRLPFRMYGSSEPFLAVLQSVFVERWDSKPLSGVLVPLAMILLAIFYFPLIAIFPLWQFVAPLSLRVPMDISLKPLPGRSFDRTKVYYSLIAALVLTVIVLVIWWATGEKKVSELGLPDYDEVEDVDEPIIQVVSESESTRQKAGRRRRKRQPKTAKDLAVEGQFFQRLMDKLRDYGFYAEKHPSVPGISGVLYSQDDLTVPPVDVEAELALPLVAFTVSAALLAKKVYDEFADKQRGSFEIYQNAYGDISMRVNGVVTSGGYLKPNSIQKWNGKLFEVAEDTPEEVEEVVVVAEQSPDPNASAVAASLITTRACLGLLVTKFSYTGVTALGGEWFTTAAHTYLHAKAMGDTKAIVWLPNSAVKFDFAEIETHQVNDGEALLFRVPGFRKRYIDRLLMTDDEWPEAENFQLVHLSNAGEIVAALKDHTDLSSVPAPIWSLTSGLDCAPMKDTEGDYAPVRSTVPGIEVFTKPAIEGSVVSLSGDCGFPWVILDTHQVHKLGYFHFGGNADLSTAYRVTQEDVHKLPGYKPDTEVAAQFALNTDFPPFGLQAVGNVGPDDYVFQSRRTRIAASVIQDEVCPTTDVAGFDPAYLFKKSAYIARVVPQWLVDIGTEGLVFEIPPPDHRVPQLLSSTQCLNGVEGTMLHEIYLRSSIGHTFNRLCTDGKFPLVRKVDSVIVADDMIWEEVEYLESKVRTGIVPVIVEAFRKDERYPIEKVKAGKIRYIKGCPFEIVLLVKKYFGGFLNSLRRQAGKEGCQVGIDAEGPEFGLLFRKLSYYSRLGIFTDASSNDITFPLRVHEAFGAIANEWNRVWFDEPVNSVNQEIRMNITKSLVGLFTIIGQWMFYIIHLGSGLPWTAEANTLGHRIMHRACFFTIGREFGYEDGELQLLWRRYHMIGYGDDTGGVVDNVPWFNQITLAEHMQRNFGMILTPSEKEAAMEAYTQLECASFLKRYWVPIPDIPSITVGRKTITECVEVALWYRRSDISEEDATRDNVRDSLRELVYHGRSTYQKFYCVFNRCLVRAGFAPVEDLYYARLSEIVKDFH
jgi:hypothetical protein